MSNFSYKKTTTTAMKVAGIIDTDNMTIDVDGEVKKLATLFADFNGGGVELKKMNLMSHLNLKNKRVGE